MEYKFLRVGKIVNTQGVKGEVRVIPLTDDITRFERLEQVFVEDEAYSTLYIEYVKYHKSFVIIKFKDINSINDAEKYKNTYILVDRKNSIRLPKGSFFIADIIGLHVFDTNGESLGLVSDVISTGSNDVYVVKSDDDEILIPALKSVVREINIQEGRMTVELPEGLA